MERLLREHGRNECRGLSSTKPSRSLPFDPVGLYGADDGEKSQDNANVQARKDNRKED